MTFCMGWAKCGQRPWTPWLNEVHEELKEKKRDLFWVRINAQLIWALSIIFVHQNFECLQFETLMQNQADFLLCFDLILFYSTTPNCSPPWTTSSLFVIETHIPKKDFHSKFLSFSIFFCIFRFHYFHWNFCVKWIFNFNDRNLY